MAAFDLERGRSGTPGAQPLLGDPGSGPHSGGPDRARRRALVLLPAVLVLGGCGQKGALFLPADDEESEEARLIPTPVSGA